MKKWPWEHCSAARTACVIWLIPIAARLMDTTIFTKLAEHRRMNNEYIGHRQPSSPITSGIADVTSAPTETRHHSVINIEIATELAIVERKPRNEHRTATLNLRLVSPHWSVVGIKLRVSGFESWSTVDPSKTSGFGIGTKKCSGHLHTHSVHI